MLTRVWILYFFDYAYQVADQTVGQSVNQSWDHVFLCVDQVAYQSVGQSVDQSANQSWDRVFLCDDHIDQVADQTVDQLQPGSLLLPAVHGVVGWQIKILKIPRF